MCVQGFIIKGVKIEYCNSKFIWYLINANFANHFSNKTALMKTHNVSKLSCEIDRLKKNDGRSMRVLSVSVPT